MDWTDEHVAVGSWVDAFVVARLKKEEVDLIIDARTLFGRYPLSLEHYPHINKVQRAAEMLVAISDLEAKVLIRCRRGRDRTPFLAMLYVCKKYAMPYKDAYEFVRSKRPQTVYHEEWVRMLEH